MPSQITGAASSQALINAIEEPGWIKATPKLVQLAREFYGDRDLLPPAAPDESEDKVPLAMLKEVRRKTQEDQCAEWILSTQTLM